MWNFFVLYNNTENEKVAGIVYKEYFDKGESRIGYCYELEINKRWFINLCHTKLNIKKLYFNIISKGSKESKLWVFLIMY